VANPREVVDPGQEVKVKILEIDAERRRLSLSVKRVEGQNLPLRSAPAGAPEAHVSEGDLANAPDYGLSDDVFAGQDQHAAGLAAAAEAFGTPEQRAAFAEPASADAPAEADATPPADAAAAEPAAPAADAAPAEADSAPAEDAAPAEPEAPAADAPVPTESAEDAAPVDAEQAEAVGEAAAEVQPDEEPQDADPESAA
jgi:small subunit ribosomal protein S1